MADNDQQLVDTLNAIRGELRGLARRLDTAITQRGAKRDPRYTQALKAQVGEIADNAGAMVARASELELEISSLPHKQASPETST